MSRLTEQESEQPCPECGELRRIITTEAGTASTADEPGSAGVPRYGCVNPQCPARDSDADGGDGPDPEKPEVEANQPTGADDVGA